MMEIVVLGSGPEWEKFVEGPGEIVAVMCVDGLK